MKKKVDRVSQAAKMLDEIYQEKFGGKSKVRYRISRADLLALSRKKTFCDNDIKRFQTLLQRHGLIFIDLGAEFAVLEEEKMKHYRKVTKSIIKDYIPAQKKKTTENDKKEGKKTSKSLKNKPKLKKSRE
jgi:hypothetical protein